MFICRGRKSQLKCYDLHLNMPEGAAIQSFGERINFHTHIHILTTEGGSTSDGSFHRVGRFHDEVIQEIFTHEVFSMLLRKKLKDARGCLFSLLPEDVINFQNQHLQVSYSLTYPQRAYIFLSFLFPYQKFLTLYL